MKITPSAPRSCIQLSIVPVMNWRNQPIGTAPACVASTLSKACAGAG